MGKRLVLMVAVVVLVIESMAFGVVGHGSDLYGLARVQSGMHSKRVSSYDRTGGNNDRFERVKDGEVRDLFNVKGAGIINHIWITIAPPPERLSRNDIILRIYWDGNEFPSVESPIGPFFGQGWRESYPFSSLPLAAGPVGGARARVLFRYAVCQGRSDRGRESDGAGHRRVLLLH